jgi:hypothetical protein
MSLFDPAAVNKQLDALLATVPAGKRGTLILNADLPGKRVSGALMFKAKVKGVDAGAYVRVSKTIGAALAADAGAQISFLADLGAEDEFTYEELVAVLKARGRGWIKAHLDAYRLFNGWEVEL